MRVARLAAAQYGVFAREQVARLGATRGSIDHRIRTGRWDRVAPRVFRLAGAPPSWHQSLIAACLSWGDGAVVSHRAAAALWRLAGFAPGPVELTVPRRRDRNGPGVVHRNLLLPPDVTTVEAIAVTTPARTLLDIASVAPPAAVEEALDALRRRLVSMARLRWRLTQLGRKGRPGLATMHSLINARDPGVAVPESVFERRLLRVLKRARLGRPVAQYPIRKGGRTVAVVDFAFPDARLALEADGYRWHSGRVRWEHDRVRGNELMLLGWRVVHVTWTELARRPDAVVAFIREALRARPHVPPR